MIQLLISELDLTDLKVPDTLLNINLEENPLLPGTIEHLKIKDIIR